MEIRVWSSSACLTDKKIGFFIYRVHFWKFNAVLDLDYCFFPPNVGRSESSMSDVQKLETATVKPLFLQVMGLIPGK